MNVITREWVDRAENDYIMAQRAMSVDEQPVPEGACFHAQQCAEKYLKAFLQEQLTEFPRKHDLMLLLDLCLSLDSSFDELRYVLTELHAYSVAVRYPGINVSTALAESAIIATTKAREFIRKKLKIAEK